MNVEVIGVNAGTVWVALNETNGLTIKQLRKETKLKDKDVYAAIGWLAREGKVNIEPDPKDEKEFIVTLI
jgi:DNA-binding MarR family transcriptional regulator